MKLLGLVKPEYVFRPSQLLRRFDKRSPSIYALPWNACITCDPQKTIGRSIKMLGIYDLATTEIIWRVLNKTDIAVDAGANIGQMTLAMAARSERVYSFEPHPDIFSILEGNVRINRLSNVSLFQCALSSSVGYAFLFLPREFLTNEGVATLREEGPGIQVQTRTLDGAFSIIHLLKLDVEGHELAILKGAERLLLNHFIRDIIYEEHTGYPSPVASFLEGFGYKIFRIARSLLGPIILAPNATYGSHWEAPNYLATNDPARLKALIKPRGWRVFSSSS